MNFLILAINLLLLVYLFNSSVSGVKICKEEIELIESVVDFGNYKLFLVKQSNDLKLWKYMANGNQLIDKPESSEDVFNGILGAVYGAKGLNACNASVQCTFGLSYSQDKKYYNVSVTAKMEIKGDSFNFTEVALGSVKETKKPYFHVKFGNIVFEACDTCNKNTILADGSLINYTKEIVSMFNLNNKNYAIVNESVNKIYELKYNPKDGVEGEISLDNLKLDFQCPTAQESSSAATRRRPPLFTSEVVKSTTAKPTLKPPNPGNFFRKLHKFLCQLAMVSLIIFVVTFVLLVSALIYHSTIGKSPKESFGSQVVNKYRKKYTKEDKEK